MPTTGNTPIPREDEEEEEEEEEEKESILHIIRLYDDVNDRY